MLHRRAGGEFMRLWAVGVVSMLVFGASATAALGAPAPKPGTPEHIQRDNHNIADAYGRQTAPDAQLGHPNYLPLTYDVQGQGTSESVPHENDQVSALPFCNPFAKPRDGEELGCPAVPAQQASNFVFGTEDALSFFLSTPKKPYKSRNADTPV